MELEDTRKLLAELKAVYPQSFKGLDHATEAAMASVWHVGLKDFPKEQVKEAIEDLIFNQPRQFAPTVGEVRTAIAEKMAPKLDEAALWGEIKHYMQNMEGDYELDRARYAMLSEPIRRCYSYGDLKGMSQRASLDNDSYERPRFAKYLNNYRAEDISNRIAMKEKERAMITHE